MSTGVKQRAQEGFHIDLDALDSVLDSFVPVGLREPRVSEGRSSSRGKALSAALGSRTKRGVSEGRPSTANSDIDPGVPPPTASSRRTQLPSASVRPHSAARIVSPALHSPLASRAEERPLPRTNHDVFLDKENVPKKGTSPVAVETHSRLQAAPPAAVPGSSQPLAGKAVSARPESITFRTAKKIRLPEDVNSKQQLPLKSAGDPVAQLASTAPTASSHPASKFPATNNRRAPAVVNAHMSTLIDAMPSVPGPSGPLGDADFAKDIEYFSDMSKRNSAKDLPFAAPPRLSGGGTGTAGTGRRSGSGRRTPSEKVEEVHATEGLHGNSQADQSVSVHETLPKKRHQHPSEARKEAEERRQLAASRVASLAQKSLQEVLRGTSTNEMSSLSVEEPALKAPVAFGEPTSRSQGGTRESSRSARTSRTLQEITAELDHAAQEDSEGPMASPGNRTMEGGATDKVPLATDRSSPQSQSRRDTSRAESESPGRLSSHPYLPARVESDSRGPQRPHPVGSSTPGGDEELKHQPEDAKVSAAASGKATGKLEEDLVFLSPQAIMEDPGSRVPVADAKTLRELTEVLRAESQKHRAMLHESSNDDVETMPSRSAFQGVKSNSHSQQGMEPHPDPSQRQQSKLVGGPVPQSIGVSSGFKPGCAQVDNSSKKALVRQMRERVIEEQREAIVNQSIRNAEPASAPRVTGSRDSAAFDQPQREPSYRQGPYDDAFNNASLPRSEAGRGSWREPAAVASAAMPSSGRGRAVPVAEAPPRHPPPDSQWSGRSQTHSRVTERATSTEGASVAPDVQSASQFWSRCAVEAERLLETPRSFFDNHLAFLHLCHQQLSTVGSGSREGWSQIPPARSSGQRSSSTIISSVFAPLATMQEVSVVAQMPYPLVIVTSTVFEDITNAPLSREPQRQSNTKLLVALTNLIAAFRLDLNQASTLAPSVQRASSQPFNFLAYTEEAVAIAVKDPVNTLKVIVCYVTEPVSALALLLNANKVSIDSKGVALFRVAAWCDMHRPLFHTLRDRVLLLSRHDDGDLLLGRREQNEVTAVPQSQPMDGFVYYSDLVEGHPLVQRLNSATAEANEQARANVFSSQHGGGLTSGAASGMKPVLWRDLLIRGGISRPHGGPLLMRAHISSFQPVYHYWERKRTTPHSSEFSVRGMGTGSARVVLARCDPLAALPYLDALFVSSDDGLARYASPASGGFRDEHHPANPLGRSPLKGNIRVLENRLSSPSMASDRLHTAPFTVTSRSPAANMLEVLRLSAEYKLRVVGTTVFSDMSRSSDSNGLANGLTADGQPAPASTPDDEMMEVVCRWGYACPTIVVVFYAEGNRFSEDFLSFYTKSGSLEEALQHQQPAPVANNASASNVGPIQREAQQAPFPPFPSTVAAPPTRFMAVESLYPGGVLAPRGESYPRHTGAGPRPGRDVHGPTPFHSLPRALASIAAPAPFYQPHSQPPMPPPQAQYHYPLPSAPPRELPYPGRVPTTPHPHAGRDMLRQLVQQRSPQHTNTFPTATTFLDPYLGMSQGAPDAAFYPSFHQMEPFQGYPAGQEAAPYDLGFQQQPQPGPAHPHDFPVAHHQQATNTFLEYRPRVEDYQQYHYSNPR